MIKVCDILKEILNFAPKDLKEEWDNVGLLCGYNDHPVSKILVSLDVTIDVAIEAKQYGANLIISHHPLLFSTKSITDDTAQGRLLLYLAANDISVICAHTNLDSTYGGVNDELAKCLCLRNIRTLSEMSNSIVRVGEINEQCLSSFALFVKQQLHAGGIRYADGDQRVHKVAVGGGACIDFLPQVLNEGCDTFVTSDIKYHQFQKAKDLHINLIDAGHFPTENPICQVLCNHLFSCFPTLEVKVSEKHTDCINFI